MKKGHLLIFLVSLLISCQTKKPHTQLNNEKYVLSIDNIAEVSLDTIKKKNKYDFVNIKVKLTNLSSDAISYSSMSCSSDINFAINNDKMEIMHEPCQHNVPVTKILNPHQTIIFNLPVMFIKMPSKGNYLYQISMELNYDWLEGSTDSNGVKYSRKEPAKLIWSNKGTIIIQ